MTQFVNSLVGNPEHIEMHDGVAGGAIDHVDNSSQQPGMVTSAEMATSGSPFRE